MQRRWWLILLLLLVLVAGCMNKAPLGTKKNPIKMYFVPSMEAGKIVTSGEAIAAALHESTGYYFKVAVPTSYAAVIEALGTNEADIAWLAPFAYVLAHDKYGAEIALTTVRNGLKAYRGQFVCRTDSKIDSLSDINGKIVAYTDAASTSGYIYPASILKQKGIKPKRVFMAGSHPAAILSVYQGTADVACSFWSPEDQNNVPQDARKAILETHPDVFQKIRIIGFTDWIPNDTVTIRKGFPEEMRTKIVTSLLDYVATPEGKKTMKELYEIDGLVPSSDAEYNIVRETIKTLGMDPKSFLK